MAVSTTPTCMPAQISPIATINLGRGVRKSRQIRCTSRRLKVLLITGYAADAVDRIGFLGRDISMLPKPFAIELLSNTIRKLLERD